MGSFKLRAKQERKKRRLVPEKSRNVTCGCAGAGARLDEG